MTYLALLALLCFAIAAQLCYYCSALLLLLSFAITAQLCYYCSALLFSIAIAAQLCYRYSVLLPLLSFATATQLCYRSSARQSWVASERYSVMLSNADCSESLKLKVTSRTAIAKLIAVKNQPLKSQSIAVANGGGRWWLGYLMMTFAVMANFKFNR